MNNYEVYKTKTVTSFASCSLIAKHIALKCMLEWTIQNSTPTYTKVTSQFNKQQTSSQFQVEKWMKLSNWPQKRHVVKHSTCVYRAPTSLGDLTNKKSLLQNPNKCKLGSSLS
jgi:hypothetical protein